MASAQSTKMNERVVGDADGSLASPTQERPPQEEVEEPSLRTNPDNQQAEVENWITPLAFGRGSRTSLVRRGTV